MKKKNLLLGIAVAAAGGLAYGLAAKNHKLAVKNVLMKLGLKVPAEEPAEEEQPEDKGMYAQEHMFEEE